MKKLISNIINTTETNIFNNQSKIYTFLNPVSYIVAHKHIDIYREFDGIFIDGSILVLFIRIFYRKKINRISFDMTSLAPILFHFAENEKKNIYIIGGTEGEIIKASECIKINYPKINLIKVRSGYFSSRSIREIIIKEIINLSPDLVIVGMGANLQEKFLLDLKINGFKGIGFTCGGFISQIAQKYTKNTITYYPYLINLLNIRFIYRMYKEKHTRKRYLKAMFIFPYLFMKDLFS